MITPVISSTGLWTPSQSISNAELVESFNTWSDQWNAAHASDIEAGSVEAKPHSSVEFIEKASGIKARYVVDKDGYMSNQKEIGEIYRAIFGRHFPAMSVVIVRDLIEDGALLEIEATGRLST